MVTYRICRSRSRNTYIPIVAHSHYGSTDVQTFRAIGCYIQASKWKTIGVKVKESELGIFNKQLQRFGWQTLGDLVKDLIAGKI